MSAWLQTKSWEEAKEAIARSKGVAIVPIGSVEQHSYQLSPSIRHGYLRRNDYS